LSSYTLRLNSGYVDAVGRHMAVMTLSIPELVQRALRRNTMLILDCSGSMADSLRAVKSDAKKFVSELGDQDLVSIIIFSGHGSSELICNPTLCDDAGKQSLLDAIDQRVRVMGLTVFSEPLKLALEKLRDSQLVNTAHDAVLFTDGYAVPSQWSYEDEERYAITAAKALFKFGASLSVIGYGNYYDADFMAELMMAGGASGIYRHMSDIEDFGDVIRDIREAVQSTDPISVTVRATHPTGSSAITAAYRVTPEVAQVSRGNSVIQTRGVIDGELVLYLDVSGPFDVAHVNVSINGGDEEFAWPSGDPLTDEMAAECIRVTAIHHAVSGDKDFASELFDITGDEGLAQRVQDSYTSRDKLTTNDLLRSSFRRRRFIGAGIKPTGPSHCVLNVLRALAEDPTVIISIPRGAYKRGGLLYRDPTFVDSPLGRTLTVIDLISNLKRFNFSVLAFKQGHELTEGENGEQGLEAARTPRSYNIIRDGELVMKAIMASMAEATFNELQEAGVIGDDLTYVVGQSYDIDLGDMPMVSSAWARPNGLDLVRYLAEEKELKAEYTALNAHLKTVEAEKPERPWHSTTAAEKVEGLEVEYYDAPSVELELPGYEVQFDPTSVKELTAEEARQRFDELKYELRVLRYRMRSQVYACHLIGWPKSVRWSDPRPFGRTTPRKEEQFATIGGERVRMKTWTEQVPVS
jgi:Mg-chelatase subunit ChlD